MEIVAQTPAAAYAEIRVPEWMGVLDGAPARLLTPEELAVARPLADRVIRRAGGLTALWSPLDASDPRPYVILDAADLVIDAYATEAEALADLEELVAERDALAEATFDPAERSDFDSWVMDMEAEAEARRTLPELVEAQVERLRGLGAPGILMADHLAVLLQDIRSTKANDVAEYLDRAATYEPTA